MLLLINKVKNKKPGSGVTLVETMVSLLIFSAMATTFMVVFVAGRKSWDVHKARIELQQDLRIAADRMKDELSEASSGSIVNVDADDTWYTSITFRVPESVDGYGNITWPADTTKFLRHETKTNQLIRRFAEGTAYQNDRVLAENIAVLKFRRLTTAPNILEINIKAEKDVVPNQKTSIENTYKVNLRN